MDRRKFIKTSVAGAAGLAAAPSVIAQEVSAEAMLLPLNGSSRSRISESLLRYFSFHMESDLHIRSLEVLSALR